MRRLFSKYKKKKERSGERCKDKSKPRWKGVKINRNRELEKTTGSIKVGLDVPR